MSILKIQQALEWFNYDSAVFLAERLVATDDTHTNVYWLAKALYSKGEILRCLHVLDPTQNHYPSLFLYAKACLDLDKLLEGEAIVQRLVQLELGQTELANCYYILSQFNSRLNRFDLVIEYLTKTVELDPFHWAAFRDLCDLGQQPKVDFLAETGPREVRKEKPKTNPKPFSVANRKRTRTDASLEDKKVEKQGVGLNQVIQQIYQAYSYLKANKHKLLQETVKKMPYQHQESALVQSMLAKSYFETGNYTDAEAVFRKIRRTDVYRAEDMDLYGTCLWHLKKAVDISHLAKEMQQFAPNRPETCVVLGNYHALNQEHESAIASFKKAIENHPHFYYGHTLLGHEYFNAEDLENAMKSYKQAYKINPRHYNAIYGIGMVHLKEEKLQLAEYHFRRALEISPYNTVLLASIGMCLEKIPNRVMEALEIYEKAIKLAPHHEQFKISKAQILHSLSKHLDAIKILEKLIQFSKPNSQVYFLLGKCYAATGRVKDACLSYTLAQDFKDHKSISRIRDALDKLVDSNSEEF
ncbi:hypothetical protein EDD86DRAFT_205012 [Gorgonomyces haynaldii]|nr:hypothetical protein EDD86DRAFT_205012 [Gorgonomyces haynaldii]